MAVTNVTIDAIIRRHLALNRLPLHYYVPMLVIAKQGLEEMHFDTLGKVKIAVLTVTAANEAVLPDGYVEAIMIGVETGDKVRAIGMNNTINPKDNAGAAFEESADQYSVGQGFPDDEYIDSFYDEYGHFKGQQYGRVLTWSDSFTINRDLGIIRVDNKFEGDEIFLMYLSMPEKVTNKSVLHPFAQRALSEYIGWQKAVYFKEGNLIQYKRNEYYNELRKLRARLNPLTTVEIKRAVRRNINLAVK